MSDTPTAALLRTPLHALHLELGARMVPFAGYEMPVQYPAGLMAEHLHTRQAAGLFDVSHMGQLRLVGSDAAAAFESLIPMDVVDLTPGRQRYGLLLNDAGGILDDLMFIKRADGIFVIVNGACKVADIAHIQERIGQRCAVQPLPEQALLALQGPQAVNVLARLAPAVTQLVFMTGGDFLLRCGQVDVPVFLTRSGYTGEDGFEISVAAEHAELLARTLLAHAEVRPIGLGARNSLRLEAGLCLYGNDIDQRTTPAQAQLLWAIQKVRRSGGARAGGFPGAARVLGEIDALAAGQRAPDTPVRVGLRALARVPVREHTPVQDLQGKPLGEVCSGLLGPSVNEPIAMAYLRADSSALGTEVHAMVRGKAVAMQVVTMPFAPTHYYRG